LARGFEPTRLLASESGWQVLVNTGADSVSQSVRPNQNVGWSSNPQVVPVAPDAVGCVVGSTGRVMRYVMSLPDPATPDLN
jgi:hypothetical protein